MTRVNFKDLEGDMNDIAWNRPSSSKAQTSKWRLVNQNWDREEP